MAKSLDDVHGIFSYEKSFKEWLEDIFSSRASSDYPSRLRKFFTQYYKDKNMFYQGMSIYRCLNHLPLDLIQRWIDICLIQADNISDAKEKSNIKSAINKFRIFLEQNDYISLSIDDNIKKTSEKEDEDLRKAYEHLKSDFQLTFSKNELCKIFLTQFKSEDRRLTAKTGLIYPIKAMGPFIHREIGDKSLMTKFFEKQIDKIKIYINPSNYCLFRDIRSLTLDTPDSQNLRMVQVVFKDKKEYVYTQDGDRFVPMRVKTSSDINRDHDKSISKILENLDPMRYPCLNVVSEVCRNTRSKKSTAIQTSLEKVLIGKDSKAFAADLFEEIKMLFQQLSFTLMEGSANRKKSASV